MQIHLYVLIVNQLWRFWNACIINLNTVLKFSDLIGSLNNNTQYEYDGFDASDSSTLTRVLAVVFAYALRTCLFVLLLRLWFL